MPVVMCLSAVHVNTAYDSCAHDGHAVTDTFLMILSVTTICCSGDGCHCLSMAPGTGPAFLAVLH